MAIVRQDEILEKALSGDPSAVPRFNLRAPDGTLIYENVAFELANAVTQTGTPVNAAALNEMLAASGVTAGTASAYALAQEGFALFDGAPVRFRLHTASGANATLNINGTGAKPLIDGRGNQVPAGYTKGAWIEATYSAELDSYVVNRINNVYVTTLTAAASSIRITLPEGYKAFKLTGTVRNSASSVESIRISANVSVSYMRGRVDIDSSGNLEGNRVSTDGTTINTGLSHRVNHAMINLTIVRNGVYNALSGIVASGYGFAAIGTDNVSSEITYINISGGTFAAGTTIILEGIA